MLVDGINHVAIVTSDIDRFHNFYVDVFDAEIGADKPEGPGGRLSFVRIGPQTELNVFQAPAGTSFDYTTMFGRGPIDHLGLQAADKAAFDEIRRRLMARGAADDFVTDFGPHLSIFFRDPDGLECEVLVENPNATPGVLNPPGTRASGY